jgi:hypothetical protein
MLNILRCFRNPSDISWIIGRLSLGEIDMLIESLQKEAKIRDENQKKELEKKKSGITIVDFVSEIPMSARLRYALQQYEKYEAVKFIDDVSVTKLQLFRNFGKKSWLELINIINHSLQGSRFEAQQEILQNHFIENK